MMHLQKTTLRKGLDNPQFCGRVLKKKVFAERAAAE